MGLPKFTDSTEEQKAAVVVSLDMSGFSDYCRRPDSYKIVPKLIARFFEYLEGSLADSSIADPYRPIPHPDFSKFTGDGAILLWTKPQASDFEQAFCNSLVERLRVFKAHFEDSVPQWEKRWKTSLLPSKVRIGVTIGTVYPLRKPSDFLIFEGEIADYVGYCMNLAVRLQDHCRELGMLVHGSLHIDGELWEKVRAIKIKDTGEEDVYALKHNLQWYCNSPGYSKKFKPRLSASA